MKTKTSLIITSISKPNAVLEKFAKESKFNKIDFILIGDEKSPKDFHLNNCNYYSIEDQKSLSFELAEGVPKNHYSRKNLGYLLAIQNNTGIIIESDDDNIPYESFWKERRLNKKAYKLSKKGWANVYKYFTEENIWPRGFDLKHINAISEKLDPVNTTLVDCPIQQGLADLNPDVDAIYRLALKLPIQFNKEKLELCLDENVWCPFNSQNTTWFKEAFPLLYLPSYCSFRMTDIWRSFVAQRIAWTMNWKINFHEPTVYQERNEHNLMKDFEDEIPGYLGNEKIVKLLQSLYLKKGIENINENLLVCYESLIKHGFIKKEELNLLQIWIKDLKALKTN